jgi:hypothetical protein
MTDQISPDLHDEIIVESSNEPRWGRLVLLALALDFALASLAWILVGLVMRT